MNPFYALFVPVIAFIVMAYVIVKNRPGKEHHHE